MIPEALAHDYPQQPIHSALVAHLYTNCSQLRRSARWKTAPLGDCFESLVVAQTLRWMDRLGYVLEPRRRTDLDTLLPEARKFLSIVWQRNARRDTARHALPERVALQTTSLSQLADVGREPSAADSHPVLDREALVGTLRDAGWEHGLVELVIEVADSGDDLKSICARWDWDYACWRKRWQRARSRMSQLLTAEQLGAVGALGTPSVERSVLERTTGAV